MCNTEIVCAYTHTWKLIQYYQGQIIYELQRLLHQKASIYMIVERNCAWTIHFSDENRSGAVENYRRE